MVFHKVNIYFEWAIILLISFLFYKNGFKKEALKNILFFGVFSLGIPSLDVIRNMNVILMIFGLADKLTLDGKIMGAVLMPLSLEDYGANVMFYIPKLLGQSHEKAGKLILDCLEQLKKGNFSDDLFEATHMTLLMPRLQNTESLDKLSDLFLNLEVTGQTYEEYLQETERIKTITKEEVVAIANKYFGNDYLEIRSRMGFPAKDKIKKPDPKDESKTRAINVVAIA